MSGPQSPRAVLEVEHVSKRYGAVSALEDVSFTAGGEVFGLLGGNGAGKSTLFRAILHLLDPDQGRIRVAGHDARTESLAVRRVVGYLPEEPVLDERLTGAELLCFVAGLRGLDNAHEQRALLAELSLEAQADKLIADYSLGMRKKVALIAALMGRPRVVLLDEPLNGLDTEHMRRLRLRIEAMVEAGTTVILSSHVMSFVERVCQRVAILRRGRLSALGTTADLRREAGMPDQPFEDVFLHLASDPLPATGAGDSRESRDPGTPSRSMS